MRWGVEKRLEFIEFRLFWEGGINRGDIMDLFGVSVPQASKDLTLYEEKAPGNLVYDKSAKRYLPAPDFKPVFFEPHASMYLAQLRSASTQQGGLGETWLSSTPAVDAMPVPSRRVGVNVLRAIVAVIRHEHSIEIQYQSMNPARPAPAWRRITPHAFGHDGMRWHVRAYCHIDQRFKDFILSRCLQAKNEGDRGAPAHADRYWHEFFKVTLEPNPALSETQRSVIAHDYEMSGDKIVVPVRKALLYYFQKRLRLDIADVLDKPQESPVIIANRAAFDAALAEAMS
jgi:predicted DNA-binding transcriptional regulator YafY